MEPLKARVIVLPKDRTRCYDESNENFKSSWISDIWWIDLEHLGGRYRFLGGR